MRLPSSLMHRLVDSALAKPVRGAVVRIGTGVELVDAKILDLYPARTIRAFSFLSAGDWR